METLALTVMSVPVTLPGLAAVLLVCLGLYLAVRIIRMPPERPGVKCMKNENEQEQPDGMGGIVAVVLCIIFLALIIIVPARKGASPGAKFALAGFAVSGLGWGLRQIRLARAQDKRDAQASKEKNAEKGV